MSRAKLVIEYLFAYNFEDAPLPALRSPLASRDALFNTLFCRLISAVMHGDADFNGHEATIDRRRVGEMSYLRLYDIMRKHLALAL